MKDILKTVFVYVGLIIGAGFASGREILEYFNLHSNTNFSGVLISAALFSIIAYLILSKAAAEKIYDFNSYIKSISGNLFPYIKSFMLIYMFCGLFVMFSGSGALISSLSVLEGFYGSLLMAILCFVVLSFDLKGIVTLNMIVVPFMILGIIYITFANALFGDTTVFFKNEASKIALSAVCYCIYNTVTAGAVLVPLAKDISFKAIKKASIIAGLIIGTLIFMVWLSISLNFDKVFQSELPMLSIAATCGKISKWIYSLVLFMAIFTTASSYGFGLMSSFLKYIKTKKDRLLFAGTICLSALPFSMYGFSNLVAQLYSFFGYIGIIWILMIVIDKYR